MTVEILGYPLNDLIWPLIILIKNTALGTASVGLAIGACLLSHFLFNLSRMPKHSREYRQMSYHLQTDTFVRYIITIICLLTVNILFYGFFDLGKVCTHIGVVIWSMYFLLKSIKWIIGKGKKKGETGMSNVIFLVICISTFIQFDAYNTSETNMVKLSSYSNSYEQGKFQLKPWQFWTEEERSQVIYQAYKDHYLTSKEIKKYLDVSKSHMYTQFVVPALAGVAYFGLLKPSLAAPLYRTDISINSKF